MAIILLIAVSSSANFAQNSILDMVADDVTKGDRHFEEFSYALAIESYLKSHDANKKISSKVALKIAECYRKLNDPQNTVIWYENGLKSDKVADATVYLNYADALSGIKRYADAKKWYEHYGELTTTDKRVEKKINTLQAQDELFRNVSAVSIKKQDFNGPGADFSPALFINDIVFVSSRKTSKALATSFLWDDTEYLDFYQANKEGQVTSFSHKLNTKYHEGPLVFYENYTKVIFTRNNYHKGKVKTDQAGITKLKLYTAEHAEKSGDWVAVNPLPFNSDDYSVGHPAISTDGTTLYFASDMPGGLGGTDLYRSYWKDENWSTPENLGPTINTEGNELFPFFHNDKDLYFASNGHGGLGGLDIFGVDISKKLNGKVSNAGAPINSNLDDFGIILQDDGLSGYFSTNREKSLNNDDIYSFTTTEPLIQNYVVKGVIYDKTSNTTLKEALVYLLKDEKVIATTKSDMEGNYSFLVKPNTSYELHASSKDDLPTEVEFATIENDENYWEKDIFLIKDFGFDLLIVITNKESGMPIEGVKLVVTDNLTNKTVIDINTGADGQGAYEIEDKELNDRVSFQIQLSKEGFISKSLTYNGALDQPGRIDLSQVLDTSMDKIEIGTDIGKLIDIQPIYFDLGKYSIRQDAAHELDKIVKIMNENPTWEIELGSHTDARGSSPGNLRLSDKRAKSSADYIVSQGISASRIVGKGYGESLIINRCIDGVKCSEDEHQLNRRTEFKITKF